jgi:hypothetical protein
MIKNVDENGRIEFTKVEIKKFIRHLGYRSTKRRIMHKVAKKALIKGLELIKKEAIND